MCTGIVFLWRLKWSAHSELRLDRSHRTSRRLSQPSDYTPTSRLELERAPGIRVASILSLGARLSPTSTGITAVGVLRQMISNSVDLDGRGGTHALLWGDAELSTVVVFVSTDVAGALSVAGIDIVLSAPAAVRVDAASNYALNIRISEWPSDNCVWQRRNREWIDLQQRLQSWQQQ